MASKCTVYNTLAYYYHGSISLFFNELRQYFSKYPVYFCLFICYKGLTHAPFRQTVNHKSFISENASNSLSLSPQGGIYIFQLIDYYGFNGACYFFMCLIEALVIGWIFGTCYCLFSYKPLTTIYDCNIVNISLFEYHSDQELIA